MHAFTLIEMILAIGVAAMVLIAVNTALFASLRLRDATQNVVDAAAPLDQAVSYIRRDLAREAGDVQRLDRHRNDDGQKQHRRQHLGQRECRAIASLVCCR